MSYFVIKGPAGNGQYLGPTICDGTDYKCPQWRGTRKEAVRFPDEDSAWKWIALVQEKHPESWYQGRVIRVQTARDWKAERAQILARNDELRLHIELKEMVIKARDAEIERLSQPSSPVRDG